MYDVPRKTEDAKHICGVMYNNNPDGRFKYMVAAEIPDGVDVSQYEVLEIPKMAWAVFLKKCTLDEEISSSMQNIWKRIPD